MNIHCTDIMGALEATVNGPILHMTPVFFNTNNISRLLVSCLLDRVTPLPDQIRNRSQKHL